MRIVTYLPALASIGGVELNLFETTRELAARGHRICLFYERPGNLAKEFASFCETMSAGPSPLYTATPSRDAARIFGRAIAASRQRPDAIYVNNFSELAWAAATRSLSRAPIVCQLHEFRPVRPVSLTLLGQRANRFAVCSRFMREAWSGHGLDRERVEVIHCGIDPDAYPPSSEAERLRARRSLGLPDGADVVLYMGRLIPEKGIDLLLDAWRRLGLPADQARLLIVGLPESPDPYVESLRANAPDGCEWLPFRRDVTEVLHCADVLALPSRWDEPFGRVILEAMATGRPAVASAVGGIPEILDGEFKTMLFPRDGVDALAERLRALRGWRRADPGLAARCTAHIRSHFSLDAAVTRLEEVLAGDRQLAGRAR